MTMTKFLAFIGLLLLVFPTFAQCRENVTQDLEKETWVAWDYDSQGVIHIVWNYNSKKTPHGGPFYVYYCNYNPDTNVTSPQVKVGFSGGHRAQTMPDIAVDSHGKCHIVWVAQPFGEAIPPGQKWDEKRKIMYTSRDANGQWLLHPIQISGYWGTQNGHSSQCRYPHIEIDAQDNPRVMWSQRFNTTEQYAHHFLDVWYRKSNDGGATWLYEEGPSGGDPNAPNHGLKITSYETSTYKTFLPQKPKFRVADNGEMFLAYMCARRYPEGDNDFHVIYYLHYDGAHWSDGIGEELGVDSNYEHQKNNCDIIYRNIAGTLYPCVSYTKYLENVEDISTGTYIAYQKDQTFDWFYQEVFAAFGNTVGLDTFPSMSYHNPDVSVLVVTTLSVDGNDMNIFKIRRSDLQSNWTTIDVEDTQGLGIRGMIRYVGNDITAIYPDTVMSGSLKQPDLYYFCEN